MLKNAHSKTDFCFFKVTDIGLVHLCGMLRGPGSGCSSPAGCRFT